MILTWLVFLPAIGGALAWIAAGFNRDLARWVAMAACAAVLGMTLGIWRGAGGALFGGAPFLEHDVAWVIPFGIRYHLAMDGLSLLLCALTGLLGVVAVAASWREIDTRVGAFHFALLALLSGVLGVFLAFDLFLFYFFWELMLIPMYLVIAIWGHEERIAAALKFFIFTFAGGLLMLLAILGVYFAHGAATGVYTFDLPLLVGTPIAPHLAFWLMFGFFVAFAVKLPAVPIHSWLPDAHTQAPTAGSIILAGVMLKTGAYGFLRFAVPLFPAASAALAEGARILGVAGILYGAFMAYAQPDLKRLVAYTSISHLGFVLLGIYAGTPLALGGAVMGMIAHGLSTGALFMMAGIIQERCHTRAFARLGGLWATAPRLGGFTLFFALAALGLPGLADFIAELLVLVGTFQVSPVLAIIGSGGLVVSVIYALRLVQDSVLGPNRHGWRLPDLNAREVATLGVLAALLIYLGLRPAPVLDASRAPLETVRRSLAGGVRPEQVRAAPPPGPPPAVWEVEK
ncbi:MAG TPA: NADH-quinone oxidoreductase subunit M [Polyangia bacterium]|jgi:NADH-quinone oxidoreductase subunit M